MGKINIKHWDSMSRTEKQDFLRKRRTARERYEEMQLWEKLVGQPIRARIADIQACKHVVTIKKTIDPTEIGDKAIEGGVETRCINCKRLVAVS